MVNSATTLGSRIQALHTDYVHCIDDDRLEEWPDFFTEAGRYRVITRENHELGLPVSLIYCDGRGMLADRISAMRTARCRLSPAADTSTAWSTARVT